MSSSVFKVYEEDRDRNLLLPQEIGGGGLDDSSTTEDGNCPVEATSSSGSSSGGVVDERLKIDSNLVIVVGKDGSVHVDQKTLHSLLGESIDDININSMGSKPQHKKQRSIICAPLCTTMAFLCSVAAFLF